MKRYRLFLILFGLCLSSGTNLARAEPLSLEAAEARAESVNPGLTALHEHYLSLRERVPQAAALPDPMVQALYFGESVQTRTGPQKAAFSLSQKVPWPAKLRTRKAKASVEADAAALRYQDAWLKLKRELALSYFELGYLHRAVTTTEENFSLLEDLRAVVEEQVRTGGSTNRLLRLDVEIERNRDELSVLKQKQASQRAHLAALLDLPETELGEPEAVELPADSPTPELSTLMAAMMAKNPELEMLRRSVESARFSRELAKLEQRPDFTFGLNYIDVGQPSMPTPDAGQPIMSTPDAGRDPWSVSVAVNLPIWQGKNRAAINEARAMERSTEARLRDRELQLKAELSSILARWDEGAARLLRYREKLIPLAEQALKNTQSGFKSGQLQLIDWIDSQRSLLALQLNQWRAGAELHKLEAGLEALTATKIRALEVEASR